MTTVIFWKLQTRFALCQGLRIRIRIRLIKDDFSFCVAEMRNLRGIRVRVKCIRPSNFVLCLSYDLSHSATYLSVSSGCAWRSCSTALLKFLLFLDAEAEQRENDSYLFDLENREGDTFCIDANKVCFTLQKSQIKCDRIFVFTQKLN